MSKFSVHYDPNEMIELNHRSPFNLKKDIKDIPPEELKAIAEEIGNKLIYGYNHPSIILGYITKLIDAAWVKIKTLDLERKAGKSNGYRCILLLDLNNKHAFLLHIYRHGHGENKNINKKEANMLKALVNEYSESLSNQKEKKK